eukprot:symbB.v1.2.018729.t2/scaffold1505.1/size114887/1
MLRVFRQPCLKSVACCPGSLPTLASRTFASLPKPQRDPERPLKPATSWLLFLQDFRAAKSTEMKAKEVLVAASKKWKEMPGIDKEKYEAPAKEAKEKYQEAMKAYIDSGKKDAWSRDPLKPKKPPTPWIRFLQEHRQTAGGSATEVLKSGSAKWKNLSPLEKTSFEEGYAEAKEKFANDLKAYKESGKEAAWEDKVGISKQKQKLQAKKSAQNAKAPEKKMKGKEKEKAKKAKESEKAKKAKEKEVAKAKKAKEAEKVKKTKEAEKAKEALKAKKAKEALKAKKAKEALKAKKAKEALKAKKTKKASPVAKVSEKVKKAKAAEKVKKAKEAEKAKKAKEAEKVKKAKEAEKMKKAKAAEKAKKAKMAQQAKKAVAAAKLKVQTAKAKSAKASKELWTFHRSRAT